MELGHAKPAETHSRSSRASTVERTVLPFPQTGVADGPPTARSSLLWQALRDAIQNVGATLSARGGMPGVPPHDVEATAEVLCAAVRQIVRGREPLLPDFPATIPVVACLRALRREFLERVRGLSVEVDHDALIDILEAVEQVQDRLESDSAQRFVANLSGRNGADLLAEVVHDMRSPLGSILFLVETLRKGQSGSVNAVQERQLAIIYNAAFALSSLTSDLTELARGCDRLMDVRPAPFSVAQVIRAVGAIVQPIAEEKGLRLELCAPASSFRLGHAAALQRVLLNLTTNALKFTNEGAVQVDARQRGRSRVEFAVTDSGRGIPAELVDSLFDTFRPRQRGDHAFSSAGLGLTICRKLVASMGGELRVEPGPSGGSRFLFTLELPPAPTI